jgi:hypothetical protein
VFLYLLCRQFHLYFYPSRSYYYYLRSNATPIEWPTKRCWSRESIVLQRQRTKLCIKPDVRQCHLQTCDLDLISIFQACLRNWRIWVHPVAINHKPRPSNSTLPAGTLAFRVFVRNPRTPQKRLDDGAAACCWSHLERNVFRHTRSHDQFEYVVILFCGRLDIRFGFTILCSTWRRDQLVD